MLTNSLERRKGELLTQLAQERVQALESADTVRRSAQAGVATLRSSERVLRCVGLAVAGLAAAGACLMVSKGTRKKAPLPAPVPKAGLLKPLILQAATIVLFPYLRDLLAQRTAAAVKGSPAMAPLDFSRFKPSHLFFRWLGLEK